MRSIASSIALSAIVAALCTGTLAHADSFERAVPAEQMLRDLRINRDGVRTVLRLRTKFAAPHKELTDPERYIDESLLRSALGS